MTTRKTGTGYDPRKEHRNPEVPSILRAIDKKIVEFRKERRDMRKRGHATVLVALLEDYLDEPLQLPPDLREGGQPDERSRLLVEEFPRGSVPFLGEYPFDSPGSGEHFFLTDTGMISPIYDGPPLDPYMVGGVLMRHGPHVHSLSRTYVTPGKTENHLASMEALHRVAPKRKSPGMREGKSLYFLLADPGGIWPGSRVGVAGVYVLEPKAREMADRLAQELSIRFMVARVRITFCTR